MKNLKKLIAVVLTFALVFSAMAVGFAATTPFTDVKDDAPYASAVARLYALNITNGNTDGTYGVDQPVTRAMMTVFVNRLSGNRDLAEYAKNDPPAFKDVSKNYWAVGDINLAAKLGLTHGVGNGMFDPEGKVTYAQALGFMLNLLGYKDLSWPYGVLAKAKEIGLTAGVNLGYNDVITRGDLALVMDKALETPMVKYDKDGVVIPGDPLISKIATTADYTIIATKAQDSTVADGKVAVLDKDNNLTTINAGTVDFTKFLGKKVTVYSPKNGDPVYAVERTNDVVTFTEGQDSVGTTVYKNDDAKTAVKVADNAYVLYNGYLTKISKVTVKKGAEVTIINNNYLIVNGSYDKSTIVYNDVQSGDKYLNRDSNYELKGTVTVSGAVSKVTDIKANDYVYYGNQYDVNGNVVGTVVYVVRNQVTGTVTEKAVSESTYKASIDNVSYTVADNNVWNQLTPGNKVTVILNKDNVIVGVASTTTTTAANYAIFKEVSNPFTAWFAKVKLIMPDGSENVFDAVYSDVYNKVSLNEGTIVTYKVDANGKLNDINNANAQPFSSASYKADAKVLTADKTYYITDNTVLLNNTSDGYKALKLTDLKDATNLSGSIVADNYNVAKVVVFNNASFVSTTISTVYAYVTGTADVYVNGSTFTRLTVLENGQTKTYDANSQLNTNYTHKAVVLTLTNGKITDIASPTVASGVKLTNIDQANLRITDTNDKGYLLDPNFIVVDTNGNLKGLSDITKNTVVNLYTNDVGKVFVIEIVQ
ncbi:S-layer homology domain-containing protein [Thermoanaerobacter sp. RKWS2]|uniref:S-layer homology domain-containing protein n=1 Tax=Thermoanaerobacter sp. RKWS2 TaxID=2983842 RepID=UPI00224A978A|nr:S-layer homology domain-containing protein [Thermoanaerobacter sp. RKWS2]UZQ82879.1 S-layer homology domain-containing protein [Thermoanaerobacter sp. RKWS2]